MNINGYEIKPGANLKGVDLQGVNLKGVNLKGANLEDADLWNANVTNTILDCEVEDEKTRKDLMYQWIHCAFAEGYRMGWFLSSDTEAK